MRWRGALGTLCCVCILCSQPVMADAVPPAPFGSYDSARRASGGPATAPPTSAAPLRYAQASPPVAEPAWRLERRRKSMAARQAAMDARIERDQEAYLERLRAQQAEEERIAADARRREEEAARALEAQRVAEASRREEEERQAREARQREDDARKAREADVAAAKAREDEASR